MHMASEHTVNGVRHTGEVHFVQRDSGDAKGAVVIAVVLESPVNAIADEDEDGLLNLWANDVWKSLGKVNQIVKVTHPYTKLLNEHIDAGPVYNYPGSLITPPCSEIVDWWVLNSLIYMSPDDLDIFKQQLLARKSVYHGHDARPTQSLKNRTVIAY